jgi:tol-pal system protein YbgF
MAAGISAAVPVEDSLLRAAAELDSQSYTAKQNYSSNDDAQLWARAGQADGVTPVAADKPLFYQIQILQQELRELRGLVEEQTYIIQKLQQDQRRQYVDLDRRVVALFPNRPAPGPSPVPVEDIQAEQTDVESNLESALPNLSTSRVASRLDVKPASERQAYAQAIEWMRAKRFADSSAAFEQLIVDYPNGQFTPNAFYWLGELNLATANVESARQNFVQVIRLYPDHQKVPDALYKLGVLYFQLGDETESRKYLGQVEAEYPQSSAGALAKRYLAEME